MSENLFRLASAEVFTEPFPYLTAEEGLGEFISSAFLEWLENDAPLKLVETDFYEQYEFSLLNAPLPAHLKFLAEQPFLHDLRKKVAEVFGTRLGERLDCTVHKLIPGQTIRIHNDYIPGEETHRLLIQLNRGWCEEHGGFLMLFNSEDPSDVNKVLPPVHDTVFAFAISEMSNHAVSTIHGGERFTMVFSFYDDID